MKVSDKKKSSMYDVLIKAVDGIPVIDATLLERIKNTKIFNFDTPVSYDIADLATISKDEAEAALKGFYSVPLDRARLELPFMNTCIVTPDAAIVFNVVDSSLLMYIAIVNLHQNKEMQCIFIGVVNKPEVIRSVHDLDLVNSVIYAKTYTGKFELYINNDTKVRDSSLVKPIIGKAMSLVMELNTCDRFILEVTPVNTGVKSNKYIPRSHQRSEYILLHPHEIRKYMKTESDVEGHKKRGHERRGHLRHYPNDVLKFPNAHGKVIRIPSLWVGRTDATIEGKQYKVIL